MSSFHIQNVNRTPTATAGSKSYYNSNKLQGVKVSDTTDSLASNSTIVYNASSGRWEYTTGNNISTFSSTGINFIADSPQSTGYAHGLGSVPDIIQPRLVCKASGDGNYVSGDEVVISTAEPSPSFTFSADATMIYYSHPAQAMLITDKTTASSVSISNGNWDIVINAYKFD